MTEPRRTMPMPDFDRFRDLVLMSALDDGAAAAVCGTDPPTLRRWMAGRAGPPPAAGAAMSAVVARLAGRARPASGFRFIDLFAGIGGMRTGFEAAGGRCVYTSERDRFARASYLANFPDPDAHAIGTDIREILGREETIPPFDVLLAGFPCQPFSIAGVSKKNALGRPHGFACDDQGNLFFSIASILGCHRPAAFLLENVKHLARHDRGKTFRTIRTILEGDHPDWPGIDYDLHVQVIDARAWVPQHRERVFIVGFRRDAGRPPPVFDFARAIGQAPRRAPRLGDILHEPRGDAPDGRFVVATGRPHGRYTLSDHLWRYLRDYAEKHRARGNGFGYGLFGPEDVARTLSARYHKDGSEILIRQPDRTPRRLTPRECARLMGFEAADRSWRFSPRISDTQLYRQFGNAVVPPVVAALAAEMARHLPALLDGNRDGPAVRAAHG